MSQHQENEQHQEQEQEEQGPGPIETLDEAVRNRDVGVQLYNKNLFEAALAIQMRVLEFYTKKYGDVSAEAGLPYLDYAITLLTIIQTSTSAEDAALAGNTGNEELEEDFSLCYENLEAARVCFEKAVADLKKKHGANHNNNNNADLIIQNQKRLAEVHDTQGDYFMEVDDEESAINSFNSAIEIRESADPASKAIISGHYRIGKAYYRLQIFEEAAKSYKKAIELAEAAAAPIDADFVQDLKESLEDAEKTIKDGGFSGVREEVEQMFPNQDSESAAPVVENNKNNNKQNKKADNGNNNGAKKNPLFEVITRDPLEDSLQLAPDVVIPLLPTDASNSMSHFPSQGHSRASAGGMNNNSNSVGNNNNAVTSVNTNVVMRRKTQQQQQSNNSSQKSVVENMGSRREREGDEDQGKKPTSPQ